MGLSRRGMLAFSGATAGAVGLVVGGFFAGRATSGPTGEGAEELIHPFHGEHQAGIITPAQEQLHFAAFDMMPGQTRDDLIELLQDWTYASSRMSIGAPVGAGGAFDGNPLAPPVDTGEAADHGPNSLTLTK